MYKAVITLQKAIISTYRPYKIMMPMAAHMMQAMNWITVIIVQQREKLARLRTVIVLSIVGIGSLYEISNKITVVLHSCQLSRYWRDSHDICISVPPSAMAVPTFRNDWRSNWIRLYLELMNQRVRMRVSWPIIKYACAHYALSTKYKYE